MTKDEALRTALEALIHHTQQTRPLEYTNLAIQACKDALAETQEPVGRVQYREDTTQYGLMYTHLPNGTELFTALPNREWVRLSDEEIEKATGMQNQGFGSTYYMVIRAIEAKLREKNG